MDFAWMAFSQACQVTALIAFVLLMTRLAARNRPHLAFMLWLVVLVKCVTPPLWSSPSGAFSWAQTELLSEDPDPFTSNLIVDHPKFGVDIDVAAQPMPASDEIVLRVPHSEYLPDTVIIGGLMAEPIKGKQRQLLVIMSAERSNRMNRNAIEIEESRPGEPMLGAEVIADASVVGVNSLDKQSVTACLLTRKISVKLSGVPLTKALQHISEQASVDIELEEKELAAEGLLPNEPVTINVTEPISAQSALDLILGSLNLRYEIVGEKKLLVRGKESEPVYPHLYNVADLIVPIPQMLPTHASPDKGVAKAEAVADFDSLIDLIMATVAVDTWDKVGGRGAIQPFPPNLSLVVSQTSDVHDQIADLLEQLRRLQSVQVSLETCFVRMPVNLFRRLGIDFETADGQKSDLGLHERIQGASAKVTDRERTFFVRAIEASRSATILATPKITLFNGQEANISLVGEGTKPGKAFQFQAVCSADHRSVRVGFAVGAGTDGKRSTVYSIPTGHSLVLDVTKDVTSEMLGMPERDAGVPILGNKMPYVSRSFQRGEVIANDQILLIVTPQIIVQDEDEQKVILGGVTPRIIVQQEEEEPGSQVPSSLNP